MIEIKQSKDRNDYQVIETLASEILHEVYDPIIPADHTDYFLERFQSVEAIENQVLNESFYYYLLIYNNEYVGYLGIQIKGQTLNLSKLYILKAFRGFKIGKKALQFVFEFANKKGIKSIELTVNRENQNTIEIYEKYGFRITESLVNTFPNGHTIKDYTMVKDV